MYPRTLQIDALAQKNSILLLGPRATGKSFLIRNSLEPALNINLLSAKEYARFSTRPALLAELCQSLPKGSLVVIDEIQKIPSLLDEVHRLIEESGIRFVLTGSSARKLKRGKANLLAGRAWTKELFPLTSFELGKDFDLNRYLSHGGLPRVYTLKNDPLSVQSELETYVGTYLKEEVQAEALTRSLPSFARFLEVMALQSGEELFLEGIANDTGIKAKTISNFIEVLEDTLLGFTVPAFQATKKRKAITRSKFYLFDVGITGYLAERQITGTKSPEYGKALEQFIAQELRAYLSYRQKRFPLQYWRSVNQQEVDFVVGKEIAIEVKATSQVTERDLKGLLALKEEGIIRKYILVSLDDKARTIDGVICLPLNHFLRQLWAGDLM